MTQCLKTWPIYFRAIQSGEKTFEIRKADRPFAVGDSLILQEWDPETERYTGNEWNGNITYLISDATGWVKKGFVTFGIKEKE